MCLSSPDENGFIMDYEIAYNLLKETYLGSLQITDEHSIDYSQSANELYHAIEFGINPANHGMTQAEFLKIKIIVCFRIIIKYNIVNFSNIHNI
jgi:hypothetical protein